MIEIDFANIDIDPYESQFDLYVNGREVTVFCDFDVQCGEDYGLSQIKLMPQAYLTPAELRAVEDYIIGKLEQHVKDEYENYYTDAYSFKEYDAEDYYL